MKPTLPAYISLSCAISWWMAVIPTPCVCANSWGTAAEVGMPQPDAADRERRKGELLSICQDRSSAEKHYHNATARTMWKNVIWIILKWIQLLRICGFFYFFFFNSYFYDFLFHLELFFSYITIQVNFGAILQFLKNSLVFSHDTDLGCWP